MHKKSRSFGAGKKSTLTVSSQSAAKRYCKKNMWHSGMFNILKNKLVGFTTAKDNILFIETHHIMNAVICFKTNLLSDRVIS